MEQTSNVLTARDVGRSSGHVLRRTCGFSIPRVRSAIASSVAFPACVLTRAPWHRRPGRCPLVCVPICPQRQPIVQQCPTGGRDSPARCHGANRPLRFPVAFLWPEFTFRARHCPLSIDPSHTVMGPGILGWLAIAPHPLHPRR